MKRALISRRKRRGTSALDFALCSPVLLSLLGGIVEYGWYFYRTATLEVQMQSALRVASATLQENDPATVFKSDLTDRLQATGTSTEHITITAVVVGEAPTATLEVDVTVDYLGVWGFLPHPDRLVLGGATWLEDQAVSI